MELENDIGEGGEDAPTVSWTGPIRLPRSAVSNAGHADAVISTGVARLVLSAIQHRLPQFV